MAIDGSALDPNAIAVPCGLIGLYTFNDTFSMTDGLGNPIEIDETNIALWEDRNHRFNVADASNTWLNLSSEHVMVWYEMES